MKRVGGGGSVDNVDMSTSKKSIDIYVDNVDKSSSSSQDFTEKVSTQKRKQYSQSGIYKKLFTELQEEVKEKQERLEVANYRVGQLEAQVRNSIPMLEYHRENYEKKKKEEKLKKEVYESSAVIKRLKYKLKSESLMKRIFIITLLIILSLQPLWLLWIYR